MNTFGKRLSVPLLVFICGGLWCQAVGQKQAKKDHYYGAYIGDFQDRFHGVAGQVLHGLTHLKINKKGFDNKKVIMIKTI